MEDLSPVIFEVDISLAVAIFSRPHGVRTQFAR